MRRRAGCVGVAGWGAPWCEGFCVAVIDLSSEDHVRAVVCAVARVALPSSCFVLPCCCVGTCFFPLLPAVSAPTPPPPHPTPAARLVHAQTRPACPRPLGGGGGEAPRQVRVPHPNRGAGVAGRPPAATRRPRAAPGAGPRPAQPHQHRAVPGGRGHAGQGHGARFGAAAGRGGAGRRRRRRRARGCGRRRRRRRRCGGRDQQPGGDDHHGGGGRAGGGPGTGVAAGCVRPLLWRVPHRTLPPPPDTHALTHARISTPIHIHTRTRTGTHTLKYTYTHSVTHSTQPASSYLRPLHPILPLPPPLPLTGGSSSLCAPRSSSLSLFLALSRTSPLPLQPPRSPW